MNINLSVKFVNAFILTWIQQIKTWLLYRCHRQRFMHSSFIQNAMKHWEAIVTWKYNWHVSIIAKKCRFRYANFLKAQKKFKIFGKTMFFLLCVFACAQASCGTLKIIFNNPNSNKVFCQCVFACAWSGCWTGKTFFHTPGNNKVFHQCVFACAWSGC